MKSVLSNNCCEKEEKPFPKLMISSLTTAVFLMTNKTSGTCISIGDGNGYRLAEVAVCIAEANMTDYEGDVCLTND